MNIRALAAVNYKGPTADAFGKARFSGKIPQASGEDDFFPETAKA